MTFNKYVYVREREIGWFAQNGGGSQTLGLSVLKLGQSQATLDEVVTLKIST